MRTVGKHLPERVVYRGMPHSPAATTRPLAIALPNENTPSSPPRLLLAHAKSASKSGVAAGVPSPSHRVALAFCSDPANMRYATPAFSDEREFENIYNIVSVEPVRPIDKQIMGILPTLDIEFDGDRSRIDQIVRPPFESPVVLVLEKRQDRSRARARMLE